MYFDSLDHHRLDGPVAGGRLHRLDRVHGLHAGLDAAEDRVLAVEPRRGLGGDDEELAAVGVRSAVGHGQGAALDLVVVDLVLELVAGPTRAGALRTAALNHEVRDDPMEGEPVVVTLMRELHEVLDGLRRLAVEQLDRDRPVVRVHRRAAHGLFATSSLSWVPRTSRPLTLSTTSPARSDGTSTKLKRSSTRTLRTSSLPSRVLSTTAPTTSAGSSPARRPAPATSFTYGTPSRSCGFVC